MARPVSIDFNLAICDSIKARLACLDGLTVHRNLQTLPTIYDTANDGL